MLLVVTATNQVEERVQEREREREREKTREREGGWRKKEMEGECKGVKKAGSVGAKVHVNRVKQSMHNGIKSLLKKGVAMKSCVAITSSLDWLLAWPLFMRSGVHVHVCPEHNCTCTYTLIFYNPRGSHPCA